MAEATKFRALTLVYNILKEKHLYEKFKDFWRNHVCVTFPPEQHSIYNAPFTNQNSDYEQNKKDRLDNTVQLLIQHEIGLKFAEELLKFQL